MPLLGSTKQRVHMCVDFCIFREGVLQRYGKKVLATMVTLPSTVQLGSKVLLSTVKREATPQNDSVGVFSDSNSNFLHVFETKIKNLGWLGSSTYIYL
jgi:hypothetical protein